MALLHLLKGAESISSLRDRETAANMASAAIGHLLQPRTLTWLRCVSKPEELSFIASIGPGGEWIDPAGFPDTLSLDSLLQSYPEAGPAVTRGDVQILPLESGDYKVVIPFRSRSDQLDSLLLAECAQPPTEEQCDGIFCFLHFYANYLALLDYGELDTLTGLHNRKTFDEAYDRLLHWQPTLRVGADKRRSASEDAHWLAVLDIDCFKVVNDTWGHLFGDETLLRFSRLLKQCFRNEDRLFRFGGEEFIVIIRAEDRVAAQSSFERFRQRLETTEFPQIGHITCSIGFTWLDPALPAVDVLGRADKALYFAKSNGRNQTCHYEDLVARKLIAVSTPIDGDAGLDFDIDALFA